MLKKKILFICSYNKNSGKGHLTRCLMLANQFKKQGFIYYFLKLKENIKIKNVNILNKKTVSKLNNFEFTIIDNYHFKSIQIKNLKLNTKLVYFDDFGSNNFLNPYAIINGSPNIKKSTYRNNENKTKLLLGLKYQITNIKKTYYLKKREVMLLSFGFLDEKNLIPKFINWLDRIKFKNKIFIVVSKKTKNYKKIVTLEKKSTHIKVLSNLDNLDKIYKKCYFSIGAGGIMSFERIFYRIPSILVSTDNNQLNNIHYIKKNKLGYFLGKYNKINFYKFNKIFFNFINKKNLTKIFNNCKKFTAHDSPNNIIKDLIK